MTWPFWSALRDPPDEADVEFVAVEFVAGAFVAEALVAGAFVAAGALGAGALVVVELEFFGVHAPRQAALAIAPMRSPLNCMEPSRLHNLAEQYTCTASQLIPAFHERHF